MDAFTPRSDRARLASASSTAVVPTARGTIEIADLGAGPALLALHGGMGGVDQSLLLARAALGDPSATRVLAVSRPGYLGTPQSAGVAPQQQADLYAALLDRLGVATTVVIAVSAGGPSALHFAQRHPSRCAGLILVSCCSGQLGVPPEVAARLPMMTWMARLPGLIALMRWRAERDPLSGARRSIADEALAIRTLADPDAGPLLRELQSSTFTRLKQRLPGTLNDISQFETLPEIPIERIAAPILVIHGTADRVVPFSHARRVADAAPNADLMAIDGGEHVSLFTHLAQVRARVREFLDQHLTESSTLR
jgi:pimeloyl-ACP methyl ester carboxylesterase